MLPSVIGGPRGCSDFGAISRNKGICVWFSEQMPHFYFHLFDNETKLFDPHGIDLPDRVAAVRHAEGLVAGFRWVRWSVLVTDQNGQIVARVVTASKRGA